MKYSNVFTIPNVLSLIRLVVSPFLFFLFKVDIKLAFFLFVVVSITDALDGIIARLTNSISFLGKILDPIADKVLILSLSFAFIKAKYQIPIMFVKLIIAREVFIILGSILFLYFGIAPKPSFLGKLTTLSLIMLFAGLFFENIKNTKLGVVDILYDISYILLILSFLEYLSIGFRNMISISKYKVLK